MRRNNSINILTNPSIVIAFLLVLFCVISLDPYKAYDEGLWSYIGWLFNDQGIVPYVGTVENKTPAIFLLFTLADSFGANNILFVRGLGILTTLLTALLLYNIGKKLHNKTTGIIAMWFFGLLSCWKLFDGFSFAQTETFMIFFSTLAFYFIIKYVKDTVNINWILFAGLSIGMAINFKQIAITTLMVYCLMLCWFAHDIRKCIKVLAALGLGTILSLFIVYLVLFINDVSFNEYFDGAWLILFNSGSRVGSTSDHFTNFFNVFIFSRFIVFLPLVLLFILKRGKFSKLVFVLLILWFIGDFIGANASGYYYGHQIKQLLPSLALITGVLLTTIETTWFRKDYLLPLTVFILVMLFPIRQLKSNVFKLVQPEVAEVIDTKNVIDFINKESTINDFIYVLGADPNVIQVLAKAERKSSSKYFHSIFIRGERERSKVLNDLKINTPKFIIKHKEMHSIEAIYGLDFNSFLTENYSVEVTFNSIEIFAKQ